MNLRARSTLLAALIRARSTEWCEGPIVLLKIIVRYYYLLFIIRARSTEVRRPYCICKDYCSLLFIIIYYYSHALYSRVFRGLNVLENSPNLACASGPAKNLIFYGSREKAAQNASVAPPRNFQNALRIGVTLA